MKIYDISQEIFSCEVFPGDPKPKMEQVLRIKDGANCNLSAFYMCAHNGTHVDAPFHFYDEGKKVKDLALTSLVGEAYVATCEGKVTAEDIRDIIGIAKAGSEDAYKRILIKGNATLTQEAADELVAAKVVLIGNESQTVGDSEHSMGIHQKLLGARVVILEGIRLREVPDGIYLLNAAPINLGEFDGAPCRALLIDMKE